ncbi:forkhead box protein N4-like isoform X1 [Coregonus clupeaformis]|uniref:forkhead box protein N4-like isoform X1 n=2 Tax=Coregonus clupeaformis TaxID=59861 RepID=UPI001E1C378C|nr:forkhead box protein N4-like isoform X1 [Coregonus clupeaformis]
MFPSKRLLTTELSQQTEELLGDMQSLSWLTTVDVPRLQQMATGRLAFNNTGPQSSPLELHPGSDQHSNMNTALGHDTIVPPHSNIQNSYLGMNYLNNENGNMTGGYPGSGLPASGYQSSPAHYYHSPQQAYSPAQAVQQHSSSSLYNSPSYHSHNLYEQQAAGMSITNPHSNQDLLQQPNAFPKPIYSYSCLIAMALKNSRTGSLPVSEIYGFMKEHFPYFKTAPDGWKNSVRHNLSLNKCFQKVENKQGGSSSTRKGCLWALNPAKINKMEEEMQKWKRKDLTAIRRSMANPDELDRLITDRPDGCRRKPCDPRMTCLPSNPCGSPLSGHLQESLPFYLQAQNHTLLGDPSSPVPGRTPPLHAVPDYSHSPFIQQQPYRQANSHSLYSLHPDFTTEVDALDPSIMEFAGSLWEGMREEGFSLETLSTFNHSPLCLSDCELPGPTTGQPLVDLEVSGLYTTLDPAPAVPFQYITTTEAGGQAVALL